MRLENTAKPLGVKTTQNPDPLKAQTLYSAGEPQRCQNLKNMSVSEVNVGSGTTEEDRVTARGRTWIKQNLPQTTKQ